MTTPVAGELRLSRGALLFVPDAARDLLLRVASSFVPPPGFKSARARLVLEQTAAQIGPAPSSAKARVTPKQGVPEEVVGAVIAVEGGALVVDVGFPLRVVAADEGYDRVSAALAPPLVARDVVLE